MNPPDHPKLEQLVHQTLRSLPDRRAPRTLESRVLAAIAARQARPWWRQSFGHWPLAVRAAFLVLATGLAGAVVAFGIFGPADLGPVLHRALAPLGQLRILVSAVADTGATLFRNIPTVWLYGAIAVIAALYATLFGLGATAYRALILNR
jgi:hypothetical protein